MHEEVCDIQHRDREPLRPGHLADNLPPSSIPLLSVKTLMAAGWDVVASYLKSCGDPMAWCFLSVHTTQTYVNYCFCAL